MARLLRTFALVSVVAFLAGCGDSKPSKNDAQKAPQNVEGSKDKTISGVPPPPPLPDGSKPK